MQWTIGQLRWGLRSAGTERQRSEVRELVAGEVFGVEGRRGDRVVCESGVMWVTVVGGGDVILGAGERFFAGVRGRVVVEALRAGAVRVEV